MENNQTEARKEFGLLFGAPLNYDQTLMQSLWDWHITECDKQKKELFYNENISDYIFKIMHQLALIKEPKNKHLLEATDSVIEAIKFFLKMEGGILHFTTLEERVRDR